MHFCWKSFAREPFGETLVNHLNFPALFVVPISDRFRFRLRCCLRNFTWAHGLCPSKLAVQEFLQLFLFQANGSKSLFVNLMAPWTSSLQVARVLRHAKVDACDQDFLHTVGIYLKSKLQEEKKVTALLASWDKKCLSNICRYTFETFFERNISWLFLLPLLLKPLPQCSDQNSSWERDSQHLDRDKNNTTGKSS